jgi:hypothetical protein
MSFDDAYKATSWKQGNIDEFIEASMEDLAKGSGFMCILHRIIGASVDINPQLTRCLQDDDDDHMPLHLQQD